MGKAVHGTTTSNQDWALRKPEHVGRVKWHNGDLEVTISLVKHGGDRFKAALYQNGAGSWSNEGQYRTIQRKSGSSVQDLSEQEKCSPGTMNLEGGRRVWAKRIDRVAIQESWQRYPDPDAIFQKSGKVVKTYPWTYRFVLQPSFLLLMNRAYSDGCVWMWYLVDIRLARQLKRHKTTKKPRKACQMQRTGSRDCIQASAARMQWD